VPALGDNRREPARSAENSRRRNWQRKQGFATRSQQIEPDENPRSGLPLSPPDLFSTRRHDAQNGAEPLTFGLELGGVVARSQSRLEGRQARGIFGP
jgi:hypothetical protein